MATFYQVKLQEEFQEECQNDYENEACSEEIFINKILEYMETIS
jgi:hypothetical protein